MDLEDGWTAQDLLSPLITSGPGVFSNLEKGNLPVGDVWTVNKLPGAFSSSSCGNGSFWDPSAPIDPINMGHEMMLAMIIPCPLEFADGNGGLQEGFARAGSFGATGGTGLALLDAKLAQDRKRNG
jgi:hypothetical protein